MSGRGLLIDAGDNVPEGEADRASIHGLGLESDRLTAPGLSATSSGPTLLLEYGSCEGSGWLLCCAGEPLLASDGSCGRPCPKPCCGDSSGSVVLRESPPGSDDTGDWGVGVRINGDPGNCLEVGELVTGLRGPIGFGGIGNSASWIGSSYSSPQSSPS